MKYSIISAALTTTAFASFESMKEQYGELRSRYVAETIRNGGSDRAITAIITGDAFDNINEYGCWCYLAGDHGRGHGPPVNEVDWSCKVLHSGYDCAIQDVIDSTGNDTCVPWEVFYISGIGGGEAALVQTCDAFNTDLCAAAACKIEGLFVLKVFNSFLGGNSLAPEYSHANGFDDRTGCPLVGECEGADCLEKVCCGEYPVRYPFRPLGGIRGCCGQHTYDATILQCCPDNFARLSC